MSDTKSKQQISAKELQFKQVASAVQVVAGTVLIMVIFNWAQNTNPFGFAETLSEAARLHVACKSALLPAFVLLIAIARQGSQRFSSAEDIDGAISLSPGSARSKQLQALLQNTLEQTVVAVIVYMAWASTMPATTLSVLPVAASLFAIGRVLFFITYGFGSPYRTLGFVLTIGPTIQLALHLAYVILSSDCVRSHLKTIF